MAEQEQDSKPTGNFKKNQLTLWLSIGFAVTVIMSLPSVMLILFGLLPTFVAYVVDKTPQKNAAFCVGGINICGVLPYLIDLWIGENSMDEAIKTLTDVFALVVMYGAAAFGWMLFQSLPPIVGAFITVLAQSRVSSLRSIQRKLIEEWGDGVALSQETLQSRVSSYEQIEESSQTSTTQDFQTKSHSNDIDSLVSENKISPQGKSPAEPA